MAFITVNPVVVGDRTQKPHYDAVFDNAVWLRNSVLGVAGAVTEHIGTVGAPIFDKITINNAIALALADSDIVGVRAGLSGSVGAATVGLYGKTSGTPGYALLACGHADLAPGTSDIDFFEYSTTGINMRMRLTSAAWISYVGKVLRDINTGYLEIAAGTSGALVNGGTQYSGDSSGASYTAYNAIRSGTVWDWHVVGGSAVARLDATGQLQLYNSAASSLYANFAPVARTFDLRDSGGTVTFFADAANQIMTVGDTTSLWAKIDPQGAIFGAGPEIYLGNSTSSDAIIFHDVIAKRLYLGVLNGAAKAHMLSVRLNGANGYITVPTGTTGAGMAAANGSIWFDGTNIIGRAGGVDVIIA